MAPLNTHLGNPEKHRLEQEAPDTPLRRQIFRIIFEAETPAGKLFDVLLLWAIVLSVVVVTLESVAELRMDYGPWFTRVEWALTLLFTVEYLLRVFCVQRPWRYIKSFFGIVDLLAILPTFLSLVLPGAQHLLVIRAIRLLRIFRLFKLARYTNEAHLLMEALRSSLPKITVFLGAVATLVLIMGSLMYLIEGEDHGFDHIPRGIYWAVVTLTTVGYGDIVPSTVLGQTIATVVMILGYGIIAVPTGIVSAEITQVKRDRVNTRTCTQCHIVGHELDARHCRGCGAKLLKG